MVLATDSVPNHWSFYFHILGFPYPVKEHGVVLCAGLILHCRNPRLLPSCYVKWPFGCQVRWLPHRWTTVLLKLTFVIKVIQPLFHSRLVCCILNLADKHDITLYFSIHTYSSQCGS